MGAQGVGGLAIQLLVSLGTVGPWHTLSQPPLEDPGQGALILPCPPASAPHSSHILRQGAPCSHRKLEWETLASNHRLLGLAWASSHWGLLHLQPELIYPSATLSSAFSLARFLSAPAVPPPPPPQLLTTLTPPAPSHLPAPTLGTSQVSRAEVVRVVRTPAGRKSKQKSLKSPWPTSGSHSSFLGCQFLSICQISLSPVEVFKSPFSKHT